MLKTENDVLQFWQDNHIFEKSVEQNRGNEEFVFFDGPPFASGTPHWGHVFVSQVKDSVLRFRNQQGRYTPRNWGWDCHGVPVERIVEKDLELRDKRQIEEEVGIEKFNALCKANILKFDSEWRTTIDRIGRWVDMDDQYRTMDNEFSESVWWGLSKLWKNDLIYNGFRISLYSPSLGIPLSHTDVSMEVKYQNETIQTPYVKFELEKKQVEKLYTKVADQASATLKDQQKLEKQSNKNDDSKAAKIIGNNIKTLIGIKNILNKVPKMYAVAWTTTPWTLPSNTALAVGAELEYAMYYDPTENEVFVVSDKQASEVISKKYTNINRNQIVQLDDKGEPLDYSKKNITKLATINGSDIEGFNYKRLITTDHKLTDEQVENLHKVYTVDFATEEEGTGIVHIAPYGPDDFEFIKSNQLPFMLTVSDHGELEHITEESLAEINGKKIIASNKTILETLEKENKLFAVAKYKHKAPIFDRDGKHVFYKPQSGWFIAETKLTERSLELNEQVNWYPDKVKHGRFGKGLETAPDWSISRNRYWGNPLPVWVNDENEKEYIFADSIAGLLEQAVNPVYRIINSRKLEPDFYGKYKTVILGDMENELPLGINTSQYKSKNLDEMRKQKDMDLKKFSYHAQAILEEILELFEKYEAVQMMLSDDERNMWTTWIYGLHQDSKKTVDNFYFYSPVIVDDRVVTETTEIKPFDIHKPFIDEIILKDEKGDLYHRVPDVLDCWVESGSMPWASKHYPFENNIKETTADWIMEAQDQTRGWFRTLHVLSNGVFDKPAFKNVSVSGMILANDGQKMSKSKQNYSPPSEILDQYGADALRVYLLASPLLKAESLKFSDYDLSKVFKATVLVISNVLSYYDFVAETNGKTNNEYKHSLNIWWKAYTMQYISKLYELQDNYNLSDAARLVEPYINTLSTWYIRRSKDILEEHGSEVYACLNDTLSLFAQYTAPLMPFTAEKIWSRVAEQTDLESVHLTTLKRPRGLSPEQDNALTEMESARELVSSIHAKRKELARRVRQPLYADTTDLKMDFDMKELVRLECNLLENSDINTAWEAESELGSVIIDTELDEHLELLGFARDLERTIQSERKRAKLSPHQLVTARVAIKSGDEEFVTKLLNTVNKKKIRTDIIITDMFEGEYTEVKVGEKAELKLLLG